MALSTDKMLSELKDLIRFDYDAIGAYDEAIERIDEAVVRDQLVVFRGDHERHVADLSPIMTRMGGTPPERPGVRGLIRQTMTKIAGLAGTHAVLTAMRSNENVLNKEYAERIKMAFPDDVLAVIRRNYADEQRHLAWIEQALKNRLWEQAPTTHP